MGRSGISYTDVTNAAQQAVGQGRPVTIESIRAILKTGSSSTIAQHLREWKSKQSDSYAIASKENLPQELIAVIKGLWERLVEQSEEQISVIKEASDKINLDLQNACNLSTQENNKLQQQLRELKQEKTSIINDNTVLHQITAKNQLEIASLQAKLDGKLQQLNEKQNRVDELHRLNDTIQKNLEHYRETSREQRIQEQQKADALQHQHEQTIAQQQQEISRLKINMQIQESKAEQSELEIKKLNDKLMEIKNKNEITKLRLLELERLVAKHQESENNWQQQFNKENVIANKKQLELNELKNLHATLSQKLITAEQCIFELKDQTKMLAQEKWELGLEKATLLGQFKQLETKIYQV